MVRPTLQAILLSARLVWAAPLSGLGLLAGLGALACGGTVSRCGRTLEFALHRGACPAASAWRWLPFAAVTLGHVIVGVGTAELALLRRHEQAHVAQAERWGVFFLPAYALASLWSGLRGRGFYDGNCFEVQARAAERQPAASASARGTAVRGMTAHWPAGVTLSPAGRAAAVAPRVHDGRLLPP